MIVNTDFDVVTYTAVVEELVENHFDVSGEYAPHMGMLKTMCTFYNYCVSDPKLDEEVSGISSIEAINILATTEEFLNAYNSNLYCHTNKMNFANAYKHAMQIVENKKSGFGYIADLLKSAVDEIGAKLSPVLTQENIDAIKKIASNMGDNQNVAQAIVSEYVKSGRIKEISKGNKKPPIHPFVK